MGELVSPRGPELGQRVDLAGRLEHRSQFRWSVNPSGRGGARRGRLGGVLRSGAAGRNRRESAEHERGAKASGDARPVICFDNDAPPITPSAVASAHPRAFGAFPRVLAKYVREEGVISVEEAVRKLTSLPAGILQLSNRGRVERGMAADLLIFDPDAVQDRATFTDPLSYSTGIDYVIINGELVIDEGQVTSAKPGLVIRHGR